MVEKTQINGGFIFSSTTNKQIFICFKKCYNTNDDTVYAALYIRYLGFLK